LKAILNERSNGLRDNCQRKESMNCYWLTLEKSVPGCLDKESAALLDFCRDILALPCDKEHVIDGWSNGQVEAQVNCLKLQKRIVFGRANFDLLQLRVLLRG